jgi:hypothetical protein
MLLVSLRGNNDYNPKDGTLGAEGEEVCYGSDTTSEKEIQIPETYTLHQKQ